MPTGPAEDKIVVPFLRVISNTPPTKPDGVALDTPKKGDQACTDKEGTWGSCVALLQHIIDEIEAGRMKPEDMFVGVYEENKAEETYTCRMLRYNLSPLELLGRLTHFQRDLGF